MTTTTARRKDVGTTTTSTMKYRDKDIQEYEQQCATDLCTVRTLDEHLERDEVVHLIGRMGTRHFMPSLLRVLGRANARRDETLNALLDQIVTFTRDGFEDCEGMPAEASFMSVELRSRLDQYDGPAEFKPFLEWVTKRFCTLRVSATWNAPSAAAS